MCERGLTLLARPGLFLALPDGQVQRAVLVHHQQLAEDGVLRGRHRRPPPAAAVAEGGD